MNRIVFYVFLVLFTFNSFAIDWIELTTPLDKKVYLDKDSIVETDRYFFYNIKHFISEDNGTYVETIQSSKFHPFSARLKYYTEKEYNTLDGDYKNITANQTKKLELVLHYSIVNTCFRKVSEIQNLKNVHVDF